MNESVTLEVYAVTHVGMVRDNNEDNLYINEIYLERDTKTAEMGLNLETDKCNSIFAVCDGMGGEAMGELASYAAARGLLYLNKALNTRNFLSREYKIRAINHYVHATNIELCELMKQVLQQRMGSTLAGLHVFGQRAVTFHIGDSRIYLFRDACLKQLTTDHTEAQRLVRLGAITREQARFHESKHRLTRHFGTLPDEGDLVAEIGDEFELAHGDMLLICSDGLTDMLSDGALEEILMYESGTEAACKCLLEEALKQGGRDNITIILIKVKK